MERDPISQMISVLKEAGFVDDAMVKEMDKKEKDLVVASMAYAEECPWPDPITLEEDVFAP